MSSPEHQRRVALHILVKNGIVEPRKLQSLTNMSRRTVYENLKKIREGKGHERKRHKHKPRMPSNVRRSLSNLALSHPKWLAIDLLRELEKRWSVKTSESTVRRVLAKSGIRKWTPTKQPLLTEEQKRKRVKWCQQHMKTDWKKVIFTDESYFQTFRNCLKMWGKIKPSVQLPKWSQKIMVWGGLSWFGVTALKICQRTVNSETYQGILHECLFESANQYYPNGYILQQDNATPHTSKSTRKFLEDNKITVMSWPANSPDLNPIENLWSVIKTRVEKIDPENVSCLKSAINEVWNEISRETRESLIGSMEKRLQECIRLNGETLNY